MKITIHSDGGSRGNPGPAAYGFVFLADGNEVIYEEGKYIGETTNNQAEYQGLVAALTKLLDFKNLRQVEAVEIKLDSKLVVEQVLGNWKVKHLALQTWVEQARILLANLPMPYQLKHVPRAENKVSDAMVNKALDEQAAK